MVAIFFLLLASLPFHPPLLMVASQQSYFSGNYSSSCTGYHTEAAGYLCEPSTPVCETLAYFRVQTAQFSLISIAEQLFNTTSSDIANASGLSNSLQPNLKPGDGLYIPSTCTCYGNFSSHNVTYMFLPGDTFFDIGMSTYEGLTTCQASHAANPQYSQNVYNVTTFVRVIIPLRCACPSPAQTHKGIRFLVTYPVGSSEETISSVINMFGVDEREFLVANKLANASQSLFPATTLLIPFKEKPTLPPNSSFMFAPPPQGSPPRRRAIINKHTALAMAAIMVILLLITTAASCFARNFRRKHARGKTDQLPNTIAKALASQSSNLQAKLMSGARALSTNDKLCMYTIDEIYQATQAFHNSTMIKGVVYRGTIRGRHVAVKKTSEDVSKEIQMLQMLRHSNIASLLGFCIASSNESYLVYKYAENGSLHGCLHGRAHITVLARKSSILEWHNRLKIALDIALAMEYIHDHTHPRFVHNDINSSNILLDSKMRGKMANFASATVIDDAEKLDMTHQVCGSKGYTSHVPHVRHAKVSPQADVYAFGQVLLELISGKDTVERKADGLSDAMATFISGDDAKETVRAWMDPACIDNEVHMECAYGLAMLARSCVAHCPSARPAARAVALTLRELLQTCLSHHQNPQ